MTVFKNFTLTRDLNFWADQNFCSLVGDCGLEFAAKLEVICQRNNNVDEDHLGVEGDGALVDVLPVVALSCLHVDDLPIITQACYQNEHYDLNAVKIAESITHKCRS